MIRQLIREMLLTEQVYGNTETKLRQLIRESILLTEADTRTKLEVAKDAAKDKIRSLVRGVIWEMEKSSQLNLPEEQLAWVKEYSPHIIAFAVVDDIIKILRGKAGNFDVKEDYQGAAFKWTYNQLFERMRKEQPNEIAKAFEFAIIRVVNDSKSSLETIDISKLQLKIEEGWLSKAYLYWQKTLNVENYKTIIEKYYQMLKFIQPEKADEPAKRDINLVADIDELERLVDDARPRYQEFAERRKKDSNVVQEGTHMLIDNDRWWVATIHNASAAYEHAKCSGAEKKLADWCTASPGTGAKFFKEYYREDDPLIIFKDKLNKTGYQFSFSSSQFMDAGDNEISSNLRYELILLLLTVEDKINEHYKFIHKAFDTHPLLINDRMNKLPIEERIIDGDLDFIGIKIVLLPDGLQISGNLNLVGSNIPSLPADLKVGKSLALLYAKMTSLPAGLKVGLNLNLRHSRITSLPADLQVGGDLDLTGTEEITSLPAGLQIGGGVDLAGTGITSLPDGFQVGTNLRLKNTKITSLPDDLQVGDFIYNFKGDKSQVPQHLKDKLR